MPTSETRDAAPKTIVYRDLGADSIRKIDASARTVDLAFSSETIVDRWWGGELLDHGKKSIRMDRLNNGAALLVDHNRSDQVGVIESASVGADRIGRATVRFGRSQRAQEIFQDVQDGIRSLVSVGYLIHDMKLERTGDSGDVYRITDWEPYEISLVSVPADPSVGVGRAADDYDPRSLLTTEEKTMPPEAAAANPAENRTVQAPPSQPPAAQDGPTVSASAPQSFRHGDFMTDPATMERDRIQYIAKLCEQHNVRPEQREAWVMGGTPVEEVSRQILGLIAERQRSAATSVASIGMSNREAERYSLFKVLYALENRDWKNAGFELECHRAIAARVDRPITASSALIPAEVQMRAMGAQKRDVSVAASGGGNLVSTDLVSFIDLLRNRSVVANMGATFLSGLRGNIAIPKQLTGSTAYWLATETTSITESQPTFGQVTMSPKTVGAYVEISHLLQLQSSPDAEALIMMDLAKQVALAVDAAALNGDGTGGTPAGVMQAAGIGSVSGTTLGYSGVLEFQTDVASSNALVAGCGYVTTPQVAALLKQRFRQAATDTPLWQGNILDGQIEGFRAMSSMQVPAANMLFGDFSQVVVGEWGVLEIQANPFAVFQAGITGVRALYSVDVAVRIAAAFSKAATIT